MPVPTQQFTRRELNWMRHWRSQAHLRTRSGTRPVKHSEWRQFLTDIEDQIASGDFVFTGIRWHKIGQRMALSSTLLEDTLVVRKINNNIRRCYAIREYNRNQLIRTAKQAISEPVPKTILRIDLKSCYESIDRSKLIKKIKVDALVSTETLGLIDQLFTKANQKIKNAPRHGIPRGLILSTSLAEIALRDLDAQLRSIEGTYLVLRYVDDILIFTTEQPSDAIKSVRRVVNRSGFRINESKFHGLRVACICEANCPHGANCPCNRECKCLDQGPKEKHELDFLGYKLIFSKYNIRGKFKLNELNCTFSTKKIDRTKNRIWTAIYASSVTHNWKLLHDRIRYLADNQKLATQPGRRGLLAGLAYTHTECDPSDPAVKASLAELDDFYRSRLRRSVKPLALSNDYESLAHLSFQSGFSHHRRTRFPGTRVMEIKSCWEV